MNRAHAIIVTCLLACLVECPARAASVRETCENLDGYVAKASVYGPQRALLTAVLYAESTCRVDVANASTGAIGPGQILPEGSASLGFTAEQIRDPWLNILLTAGHLNLWRWRCGNWRGAIEIFGGRKNCKVRSNQGAKIVRIWKRLEKGEEEVRKS